MAIPVGRLLAILLVVVAVLPFEARMIEVVTVATRGLMLVRYKLETSPNVGHVGNYIYIEPRGYGGPLVGGAVMGSATHAKAVLQRRVRGVCRLKVRESFSPQTPPSVEKTPILPATAVGSVWHSCACYWLHHAVFILLQEYALAEPIFTNNCALPW